MPIEPDDETQVTAGGASSPAGTPGRDRHVGTTLKNRYFIEKELGRGGFGVVYLARDQQLLGKPVVVKILSGDFSGDPWHLKKFRQEIEALARMDHPGVVGALDTGETGDGKPFLVMQFIEGVSLRDLIREGGLPLARAAAFVRQIGQALSAAHDKGIIHRDLKPENVMIQSVGGGEEYVKLIDFGIAAIKDSQFAGLNQTTKVAGSYAYMAPEQFEGRTGAESDIYAFGVMAYEMLTGVHPFPVDNLFQLMLQQKEGVKTPPRRLRPDLPEAAAEVVLRALSPDPSKRHARPRDFGDALYRALTAQGAPATSTIPTATVSPSAMAAAAIRDDSVARTEKPAAGPRHDSVHPVEAGTAAIPQRPALEARGTARKPLLAAAVVALAIAAVGIYVATRGKDAPPPVPEISLNYSLTVQKYRGGKPEGAAFQIPGEVLVSNQDRIAVNVAPPRPGYLYILNEGPLTDSGETSFNVLFPDSRPGSSAALSPGQTLRLPPDSGDWFVFDDKPGVEKLYLVWSAEPVKLMERARSLPAGPMGVVVIQEAALCKELNRFLAEHLVAPGQVTRDDTSRTSTIRARSGVLVHLVRLEHH